MNDDDGHRLEAADQFGARVDMDGDTVLFTFAQLFAFAKACERAGRAQAERLLRDAVTAWSAPGFTEALADQAGAVAGALESLADLMATCNALVDRELALVLADVHEAQADIGSEHRQ